MAFVFDEAGDFEARVNPESVVWQRLATAHWEEVVRALLEEHVRETQSRYAERILHDWALERGRFWQVVPKEMLGRLQEPLAAPAAIAQPAE
jgi:glutamate synthase (NADPH/NADH) large chain